MIKRKWTYLLLFIHALTLMGCQEKSALSGSSEAVKNQPVFERIEPAASGVHFANRVIADVATRENLFDFDLFYNGAGVGVADLNNDGLSDLFFCSNQEENKLYFNQGNLTFEDVSAQAGINTGKYWSNGVTFVDINADGWLDIYVTQGGPKAPAQRKNLLFVNQQDGTFEERAEQYGLADTGISTQAAFFDYDRDGDLDCIVANENELYGVDPINFYTILSQRKELLQQSSSHLYRNDNGRFVDVTEAAGLLRPSFALGLIVSDINEDGWLDIYLANDYYVPDAMYINNQNGAFDDEIKSRTNQITFYGMGVDIADLNNDGLKDIYVLDMASSDHVRSKTLMASMNVQNFRLLVDQLQMPHQYMFNSLQLNQGNGTYHNIAHLAHIAKTDWSWAGLMSDLDNDGWKDIFVTNGYRRYALDNDLKNRVTAAKVKYDGQVPLAVKEELYYSMPTEKLPNVMYHQREDLHFEDVAVDWGLASPSHSNGATYADLDNDGDLELIVNNMDEPAFLYKNLSVEHKTGNYLRVEVAGEQSETFAKVSIQYQGEQQVQEIKRVRGYLSATESIAHFGLGEVKKVDTLTVEFPGGGVVNRYNVKTNQVLTISQEERQAMAPSAAPPAAIFSPVSIGALQLFYWHKENDFDDFAEEILLPYRQSTFGPCLVKGDVNGDGLKDIIVGGAAGQASGLFLQTSQGFQQQVIPAFEADARHEDVGGLLFDVDQDNDLDLFVVSGGNAFEPFDERYKDRLYINDGQGNFQRATASQFKSEAFVGGDVRALDYDQDGDLDLLLGNRIYPQHYPRSAPSFIYENEGGKLTDVTAEVVPALADFGIINDLLVTDLNQDGWQDFIAVGEWTHIGLFLNRQGQFEDISAEYDLDNEKGWWFSLAETDVNNDGLKDYIVGNLGLNTKFSASKEMPFKVFAGDFDENGSFDIVLSKQYKGKYVPVRGRECSSQQMPFIKKDFPTFQEFAQATVEDIFEEKIDSAVALEATGFESIVLLNKDGKGFEKIALPIEAQFFPMLDIICYDVNEDGFEDLIVAGNIYETEVETPRWDAGSGIVLLSNQADGYTALPTTATGLFIPGDVKTIELITHQGLEKDLLLTGRNNDLVAAFQVKPKALK